MEGEVGMRLRKERKVREKIKFTVLTRFVNLKKNPHCCRFYSMVPKAGGGRGVCTTPALMDLPLHVGLIYFLYFVN